MGETGKEWTESACHMLGEQTCSLACTVERLNVAFHVLDNLLRLKLTAIPSWPSFLFTYSGMHSYDYDKFSSNLDLALFANLVETPDIELWAP